MNHIGHPLKSFCEGGCSRARDDMMDRGAAPTEVGPQAALRGFDDEPRDWGRGIVFHDYVTDVTIRGESRRR